jgi:hypothetical protein
VVIVTMSNVHAASVNAPNFNNEKIRTQKRLTVGNTIKLNWFAPIVSWIRIWESDTSEEKRGSSVFTIYVM